MILQIILGKKELAPCQVSDAEKVSVDVHRVGDVRRWTQKDQANQNKRAGDTMRIRRRLFA